MSKDDLWDPNYRSLRDAIAVVSEHFTVKGAETKLGDMLASGDPPSILQRMDGTREWLPAWKEKITLSITRTWMSGRLLPISSSASQTSIAEAAHPRKWAETLPAKRTRWV